MPEISIALDWMPVPTAGQPYLYPGKKRLLRGANLRRPAVYRWAIRREKKRDAYLVGETDELDRRLGEYLSSRGKYHSDIRRRFDEYIGSGGRIGLETLRFGEFAINGVAFSENELKDPLVRRLLEALCCNIVRRQGFELLNDTLEKRLARRLDGLPLETLVDILKKKGFTKAKLGELIRSR
jgi:hypothetical protein